MDLKMLLAMLLVSAAIPARSQVTSQASGAGLPLAVGVGYSNFSTDQSGRLAGTTIWADWSFYEHPSFLRGFGLEAEARDLNYGRSGVDPKLRMDTAALGVIYSLRHYRNIHPYAKLLVGYGSIDFSSSDTNYSHDTRTLYSPGGGFEYRVIPHVWVRGDYEYQFWPDLFHHHALNPQGFTIGVSYNFREFHWHEGLPGHP